MGKEIYQLTENLLGLDAMTSATAVVQTETSLKKQTGKPLDDGHRTLNYFAGYKPNKTEKVDLQELQQISDYTPQTRKKLMGKREDKQAYKLNKTLDGFRHSQHVPEPACYRDEEG
eukprot:5233194-Amphidinium_carterae.1